MGERRNHAAAALLGVAGLCWVSTVIADGTHALAWGSLPSVVLLTVGLLCLIGSLWAFGIRQWVLGAFRRRFWRPDRSRAKDAHVVAQVQEPSKPPAERSPASDESRGAPLLRAMGQHPEQRRQREHAINVGDRLLGEITKAQHSGLTTPAPFIEQKAAELTAAVEEWKGEVGGYVVSEPAKDWRLTLARLKSYVERELATQRAKQEQK